jgi:adenosylhomocysteine nucleosidase
MIGVITGLKFEADILRAGARRKGVAAPLLASVSGNQDHAYEEARAMAKNGARALISFGIAGGLTERAPVGTLVLAESVFGEAKEPFPTDPAWRGRLSALLNPEVPHHVAPLVSLPHGLHGEAEKRESNRATGAEAVDMESLGTAKAAREAEVPFLVVRAVSDGVTDQLPASVIPSMGPGGVIRASVLAKEIAKNPAEFFHLAGFGFKTAKANATLRRVSFLALPLFGL